MKNNRSQDAERQNRRVTHAVFAVMLLVYVFFAAAFFNPALTYHGDDHAYTLLARSLYEGKGYIELSHPEMRPHTQYPPGYPAALALVARLTGENIVAYKLFSLLCGIIVLSFGYFLLLRKIDPIPLAITLAAAALNRFFLVFSSSVLSEMMFMVVFFASLSVLTLRPEKVGFGRFVVGVVVFALSFYVRSASMFLMAGMGLYLLYRRAWGRVLVYGALCVLVMIPWTIRNRAIEKSGGIYVGSALMSRDFYDQDEGSVSPMELAGRWMKNGVYVAAVEIPYAFVPQVTTVARVKLDEYIKEKGIRLRNIPGEMSKAPSWKIMACIAAIVLISPLLLIVLVKGYVADFRDGPDCLNFITVVYVGLVLIWPSVWIKFRLLMPVFIFLWIYLVKGLRKGEGTKKRVLALVSVLLFVSIVDVLPVAAANGKMNINDIRIGMVRTGPPEDMVDYVKALEWIDANIADDALVVSRKPNVTYFHTGNRSYRYPYTRDWEAICGYMAGGGYGYILVDDMSDNTKDFILPLIREKTDVFGLIYEVSPGGTAVYEINREIVGTEGACKKDNRGGTDE